MWILRKLSICYSNISNKENGKLNSWTIENQEEITRANFNDPNLETSIYSAGKKENGIAGIEGNSLQDYVNNNKKNLHIMLPEMKQKDSRLLWRSGLNNPNFLDCFQYGVQMVFINYQDCFQETNAYLEFFKKKPFIVKNKELRYIPVKTETTKQQNKEVSYELRTVANIKDFLDIQV